MKKGFTAYPDNSMKSLPINRNLDEETRLQEIIVNGNVYSLHRSRDEIIVTDTDDYSKIYAIYSRDFFISLGDGI